MTDKMIEVPRELLWDLADSARTAHCCTTADKHAERAERTVALLRAPAKEAVTPAHTDNEGEPLPSKPVDLEVMRRDAERYQLVRRGQKWSVINGIGDELRAEELDQSIDAAIEAEKWEG